MDKDRFKSSEYTDDQKKEIEKGIYEGLDVSLYARPEFLAVQMFQIRRGLEEELPVEYYASVDYDWFQMEEIRKGLEDNVDIGKYLSPDISFEVMREIRLGLLNGIDLSSCKNLPAGILHEFRIAACEHIDISKYIQEGYDKEQLEQIRIALEKKINIDSYITVFQRGAAIREIALGKENNLDVSVYAKKNMNWQQMREIRLGLENRIDVKIYNNELYSWQQMREIRLGLMDGVDVSDYCSFMYTPKEMHKRRLRLLDIEHKEDKQEISGNIQYKDFAVVVTENAMEAVIMFSKKGIKVDSGVLKHILKENGIITGIDENVINKLENTGADEEIITIAKGTESGNGKNGWYEFMFDKDIKAKPKLLENGSVDYLNVKWFETVKKGQIVARYHPAKNGNYGYKVNGEMIPGKKGKEMPAIKGCGFKVLDDNVTYMAEIDGKVEIIDDRLEITNLLVLDNITRAKGNVDFNGSVHIKGNVGDGVVIKAENDILVDGFCEGAILEAGRDIILREGNNTGGRGYIKAKNDVMGKFFENSEVYAGRDLKANYCLNSNITARRNIEISGNMGVLAGGHINAGECIDSHDIGNPAGVMTFINVGINNEIMKEREELEKKKNENERELKLLENAFDDYQKKYPPEVRNTYPIYVKIENAIYTKELELKNIKEVLERLSLEEEKLKKAKVVIKGKLYDNVKVNIGGSLFNSKSVSNVTLKKKNGSVAVFRNY